MKKSNIHIYILYNNWLLRSVPSHECQKSEKRSKGSNAICLYITVYLTFASYHHVTIGWLANDD